MSRCFQRCISKTISGSSISRRLFASSAKMTMASPNMDIQAYAEEHESNARSYSRRFPLSFTKGQGIYLYDDNNTEFIDCLGCAGALPLGHNHPAIKEEALQFFADDKATQLLDLYSDTKVDFIDSLLHIYSSIGMTDIKFQFCAPSGADAVEASIKLAKIATGRKNIIVFNGCYHGHTQSTLAMMGNLNTKSVVHGLMEGVHFMPFPYEYRPIPGVSNMAEHCANYLEHMLSDDESGINKPAAIIFEAIQGEGGVVPAPKEWMQRIRHIANKHDILLIADEVQCGLGRSGQYFGFQFADIEPDVVCMSKAIGGGFPLSVVAYNKKFDQWGSGNHAGTFRGNQLAMATGARFLKMLPELTRNVKQNGRHLMNGLDALKKKYSLIGDVRGRGYMVGVEMTDFHGINKKKIAGEVQKACFKRKMILETGGRNGSVIRFLMPLITNKQEIDLILERFEESLYAVSQAHS